MAASEEKVGIVKMAFVYTQNGEWYKAIEEYKKLLKLDPDDPHVYNMMGDAYVKKNDDQDALDCYARSRELYSTVGNFNKVGFIDKKIAKLNPDRMDVKHRRIQAGIGKTVEADVIAQEGKVDEALAKYQEMIAAEPGNYSYRDKLAALYLENAQVTEAAEQWAIIAQYHIDAGRLEQAQPYAARMAEVDPESLETLRIQGLLALHKGDPAHTTEVHSKLAQAAYDKGEYEMAREALEHVVVVGSYAMKLLRVKVLIALKQIREAREKLDAMLKENPSDEGVLDQILTLEEGEKDWNSAAAHVQALLERRPNDPKVMNRAARIFLQTARHVEATELYLRLADLVTKEGHLDGAVNYYESILAYRPDHVEALRRKAEVFLKQGKKADVIATYKVLQKAYNDKKMTAEALKVGAILSKLSGLR
jgi:tetratricopeptide (TPR) repeat protein